MKYQPPYGVTDQNASYINGDPTIAKLGSIPPGSAWEYPMREIDNVIKKSKIVPTDDDLAQMIKAIRSQQVNYSEDTGSPNNVICAYDPPLAAYTVGLPLHVRIRNNSTGSSTIDAGAGTRTIVRANGASIQKDDLVAGEVAFLVFDGAFFQIVNFMGTGAGGAVTNVISKLPYAVDFGTPGLIKANFPAPGLPTLVAGDAVLVKLLNTLPGGATQILIDGTVTKTILANGGPSVLQGDAIAGDILFLRFDGTNFYFDPYPLITSSTTLNVPSQFSTPVAAFTALKRKSIAPGAYVTVRLAAGIYQSFVTDHPNSDRIIIQGTMIGSTPIWSTFANNGYTRIPQDSANNIQILRARYGTEIQNSAVSGSCYQSHGAGQITLQDLLFTGPNYSGSNSSGVYVTGSQNILCLNCASWGHDWGFIVFQGTLDIHASFALGNFASGFAVQAAGRLGLQNSCLGQSNGAQSGSQWTGTGLLAAFHAIASCNGARLLANGAGGIVTRDHSLGLLVACDTSTNGSIDELAYTLSEIAVYSPLNVGWTSPNITTTGNNYSIITLN